MSIPPPRREPRREMPRWPTLILLVGALGAVCTLWMQEQYVLTLFVGALFLSLLFLNLVLTQIHGQSIESIQQLMSLDEERRSSNEKFRVLFEFSTLAHLLFDEDGIIDCNNAAIRMLRCKDKNQVLSLHPAELSPEFQPDGRRSMEKCREMDALAFKNGYHCFEWMHCRMDGEVFPVEVQLTPVRLKGRRVLLVVWQDITDRRRTEQDLKQARERHELAVLGSNDGLWDWNVKTGETYFSPRWKSMIGYEDHELSNTYQDWEANLHPDDKERALKTLRDYFAGESSQYQVEFRMRCKDGSYRWILARGILRRDADGNPDRMAGSHTDITDRKKTEEDLRVNEERLQLAVQGSEEGIWDWNVRTGEVYYSSRWTEMLGYAPGEIAGTLASWEQLVHPRDKARVMQVLQDHLDGLTPVYQTEHRLRTKDGHWKWVLDHGKVVSRDERGNVLRMAGTHRDIDDRKRAERDARDHRRLLESVGRAQERFIGTTNAPRVFEELLGDLLRLTDCAFGLICEIDAGCIRPLAVSSVISEDPRCRATLIEELQTQPWFHQVLSTGRSLVVGTSPPHFDSLLCLPFAQGEHGHGIVLLADKAGGFEPRFVDFVQPLLSTCANLVAASYYERRREQTELDLQSAKEAAEQASRAKSDFLANMSHEVRTPIAAVLGFADMLLDPELNESQRTHAVQSIRRNGQHLLQIINDILDLSKIEAGKLEFELVTCSPWHVVREVESTLRVRADEKGVNLSARAIGKVPHGCLSDPTRIRQILMNLISNAIKFTESQRSIVVTMQARDRRFLDFEVKDQGIGITADQLTQLFRPFHQGDNSPTRKFGGTGLGLSISKRLAESLHGSITVESVPGQGSTFTLHLPLAEVDRWVDVEELEDLPDFAANNKELEPAPRFAGHVLVVEDNPDNQRLLGHVLANCGLIVDHAGNGREAIAKMHRRTFDVVFMDMQMPELDGYEATAIARRHGHCEPIIALTAHAMEGDRDRCLSAGCTDYLTKPVDPKALYALLARFLRGNDVPSDYARDPEFQVLTRDYIRTLPERVRELRAETNNRDTLARLAHKLKGAGSMYGYPSVTELAGLIEIAVAENQDDELIDELVDDLQDVADRIHESGHFVDEQDDARLSQTPSAP